MKKRRHECLKIFKTLWAWEPRKGLISFVAGREQRLNRTKGNSCFDKTSLAWSSGGISLRGHWAICRGSSWLTQLGEEWATGVPWVTGQDGCSASHSAQDSPPPNADHPWCQECQGFSVSNPATALWGQHAIVSSCLCKEPEFPKVSITC